MKNVIKMQKLDQLFGSYEYPSFFLPTIPKRKKMAAIPKTFQNLDAATISNGQRISKYFTVGDFAAAGYTSTLLSRVTEVTPQKALENLQRLCLEVLDPATDFVGQKPTIKAGLASVGPEDIALDPPSLPNEVVQGDSLLEALARGEGCTIEFEFDNQTNLELFALYTRKCTIFDRCVLHYSAVYDGQPNLFISVNEKSRRLVYTMAEETFIARGLIFDE